MAQQSSWAAPPLRKECGDLRQPDHNLIDLLLAGFIDFHRHRFALKNPNKMAKLIQRDKHSMHVNLTHRRCIACRNRSQVRMNLSIALTRGTQDCQPIFASVAGGGTDTDLAASGDGLHGADLQVTAASWVEPTHRVFAFCVGQVYL